MASKKKANPRAGRVPARGYASRLRNTKVATTYTKNPDTEADHLDALFQQWKLAAYSGDRARYLDANKRYWDAVARHRKRVQTAGHKRMRPMRNNPIAPDVKERTSRAMHLYERFHGESARYVTSGTKPEFPRVALRIGKVLGIMYEAKRDGVVNQFLHEFTGRSRPTLISSWDGKQIALIDGDYDFTADGIVDRKTR